MRHGEFLYTSDNFICPMTYTLAFGVKIKNKETHNDKDFHTLCNNLVSVLIIYTTVREHVLSI